MHLLFIIGLLTATCTTYAIAAIATCTCITSAGSTFANLVF
jgi:hypothetical protein